MQQLQFRGICRVLRKTVLAASFFLWPFALVLAGCQAGLTMDSQIASLKDPDPAIRRMAAQYLGGHKDCRAAAALIDALKDQAPEVRQFAAESLGQIKDPSAVEPLIAMLEDPYGPAAFSAAEALGNLKDSRAVEPLLAALRRRPGNPFIIKALGQIGDPNAIGPLIDFITHANDSIYDSGFIANAFRGIGSPAVHPLFVALNDPALKDPQLRIRGRLACALFAIKDPRTVDTMVRLIRKQAFGPCAMRGLAASGDPRAVTALIDVMTDRTSPDDESAAGLLMEIGPPAVDPLIAALQSPDPQSRRLAASALAQINHPRAASALLDAIRRRDTAAAAGGYIFYIDYGERGSEDVLIEALNEFNDEQMSSFMLNCGNRKIETATVAWGNKHHRELERHVFGADWGAQKLQHILASHPVKLQ